MREERTGGWFAWSVVVAAVLLGGLALGATYDTHFATGAAIDVATTLAPFPISFALGATSSRRTGLSAIIWMMVTFEINQGYVNPIIIVITLGPWLVGVMVRDRQRLAQQLVRSGQQLEAETALLAEESVRYERTRIAHELHDIVAHCVSVMVVQAYAGERLATRDQASAAEAFGHIADSAEQAQFEIRHLVELLACEASAGSERGLAAGLGELVAGAAATGLVVNLRVRGVTEHLGDATSSTAYRVVQEGITNALKHSPGSTIDITVDCGEVVDIEVTNRLEALIGSPLGLGGGGHGLSGMRDRVHAIGGDFYAGLGPDASWRVAVRLPAR